VQNLQLRCDSHWLPRIGTAETCTRVHPNVVLPFTVSTCTGYYDKNRPTYAQMQKLAIDVTPAPLKPVGFKVGLHETPTVRTRVSIDLDEDEFERRRLNIRRNHPPTLG
jgi:hypothetical protein